MHHRLDWRGPDPVVTLDMIYAFAAGGGSVLLGFFLGYLTGRRGRKAKQKEK